MSFFCVKDPCLLAYREIKKKLFNKLAESSPLIYIKLKYLYYRGGLPNLKNPKNISEIILDKMYSGEINMYSEFVDKIKVREFIAKIGFQKYLPTVYRIWKDVKEIEISKLPKKFVIKTNNGCSGHYICKNFDPKKFKIALKVIDENLGRKYSTIETQYHSIDPVVYCEEYIDDGTGGLPVDYKFMCLDGEIKCILVVTGREKSIKLKTYDLQWNEIDYIRKKFSTSESIKKPKNITEMINVASAIAKQFEFVRVDLYDTGERVYFSELTFTPQAGIMSYFTNVAVKKMGR